MSIGEAKRKAESQRWARAVQGQKQSGESIVQCCKRAGISRTTFYRWQGMFRLASLKQAEEDREGRALVGVNPEELPTAHAESRQREESSPPIMRIGAVRLEIPGSVPPVTFLKNRWLSPERKFGNDLRGCFTTP